MKEELIRYEWNPKTELATLVYEVQCDGRPEEIRCVRPQPLTVNPADYWDNLETYLRLTNKGAR